MAALVGASLLNLVDAIIREQGSLPLHQRRGALVVVDEMQTMPGVDYESMLSELGKFGASFILATQSLAKLDDLSRTMRDTLLANVGCLAVFQVSGGDARQLVWELGKERVTEDDITSLPVHHCYVRATVGAERMPAFSMMVRKPEPGDPAVADRIRDAMAAYTVSARQADYAEADGHRKVDDYRQGMDDLEEARAQEEAEKAKKKPDRRRQTSRRKAAAAPAREDESNRASDGGAGRGGRRMRFAGCEHEILRALASMPFLERLEMVAVTGWSRGAVYEAVASLESGGFCDSALHAVDPLPPARRFHLTARGLRRLAEEEGLPVDDLLRTHPVSAQWRRNLLERLDAWPSSTGSPLPCPASHTPSGSAGTRSMPLDAAMTLPDGRTVGVVRQGPTADRSAFARRLWKLHRHPVPGTVLVLMADDVRLRHARNALANTDAPALLALEREAVTAGAGDRIWSPAKVSARIDLAYELERLAPDGDLPVEDEPRMATMPAEFSIPGPEWDIADYMLPLVLRAAEKRALDLVADWPWIALRELAALLGVSPQRASQLVNPLEGFRLVERPRDAAGRLVLTDRGLALLSRRDRTSVGVAKRRWSVSLEDTEGPLEWRNLSGRRTRQLFRNVEHTSAVHRFLALLAEQAALVGWEVVQLDPPRRASRHFRHEERMRAVNPDAFGVIKRGETAWPFFLEWERRAVRPSTMSQRLAPIFATTHPTGPSTTTASGPRSWSSSRTRSPTPISCGWPGKNAGKERHGPAVGLPPGRHRRPGSAGTRVALAGRPAVASGPAVAVTGDPRTRTTHRTSSPYRDGAL